MKTLYLIILVAFTGITGCEKDDTKKSEPAGWSLAGYFPQEYKIGVETQDAQHGEKSGYIESVTDTAHGFGTLCQWFNGEAYRGNRVRMTGYIQSLADETSVSSMWARVDDYGRQVTADFDNMMDRPLTGTNYWTKCVIVFDVPDSPCIIYYGVILQGTGKTWFDNLTFEIVDSTVIKTAVNMNEPFWEYFEMPEHAPKDPVNLDFEQ